ncbi:hypothetical protein [Oceanobacillus oncorhynchi]|uniref:hypothetical protein n=1 Tax=Oceanobacillus oncorhynchi TaxID=545501 RepID=UPI0034D6C9A0
MKYDTNKLKGLFSRVRKGKMEGTDREDLKALAKKTFGEDGVLPDPAMLHQFNEVIVRVAEEEAKPVVTNLLGLFANFRSARRGTIEKIDIPRKLKARMVWTATGSGVDLQRVDGKDSVIATPRSLSTGFYYEPLSLVTGDVEQFNMLIDSVVDAKVRLYLDHITKLIPSAVGSGVVPDNNVISGDNLTIAQYNKLASTLQRVTGGRPVFLADTLLIDYFADQSQTDKGIAFPESMKEEYLTALNPTQIGRTTAANLVNPFIDENNSVTELPVNKGYMFAGGTNRKPFEIVEYGGLRHLVDTDIEDERVKVKISQDASINLIQSNTIGVVTENSAVSI